MALSANRELDRYVDQELRAYPVAASAQIFKGGLIGINRATGYARPLVAGDVFAGIAYEEADNSAGDDGDLNLRVYTQGDFILDCLGATQALIGAPVYALDDEETRVVTAGVASYCGILIHFVSTNVGVVRIMPKLAPQIEHAVQVPLASSTAGATTNPVLITQRPIRIIAAEVVFNTKPDAGALDVGTDNSDPDEIVDNFNLTTLTNNQRQTLTIVSGTVATGTRIWARVSQATAVPGVGGLLSMRYVELP